MIKRIKISIAVIVTIGLVAISTTLFIIIGFVSIKLYNKHQWSELHDINRILANQAAIGLSIPVWSFDHEQIDKVAESIMNANPVFEVIVWQNNPKKLMQVYVRDSAWGISKTDTVNLNDNLLKEEKPIFFSDENIGSVQVYITPKFTYEHLRNFKITIVASIIAITLILIFSLYFLLWKIVLKPLGSLEHFAENVNEDIIINLDSADIKYYGELNSLYESFRNMTSLLKTRNNELHCEILNSRKSESRFRTLVQTIPDLIWLKDPDGTYISCNNQFESCIGASEEDIKGKTDYDFVKKEFADSFRESDLRTISEGKTIKYDEWTTFASDGHIALIEKTKTPMYDAEGELIGVLGVGRDITEHKQAEEIIRHSEEQYRRLVEFLPIGVVISHQGLFKYVNKRGCEIIGVKTPEQLIDTPILDRVHPDFRDVIRHRIKLITEGNSVELIEIKLIQFDSTIIDIEQKGMLINFNGNQAILSVLDDITKRKDNEETLRVFSRVVNQSPVSVVITNIEGDIEYVNPKFTEITGYNLEEVIRRNPRILRTEFTPKETHDNLWSTIKSGKEWRGELCNRKKNGELYWELALVTPIFNEKGIVTHFLGIKEDITNQKNLERIILKNVIDTEEKERLHFSQELHDGIGPLLSATKMYVQWLEMPNANINQAEILKDIEQLIDESSKTVRDISFKLSPHILKNFGLIEAVKAYTSRVMETANIKIDFNYNDIIQIDENAEIIVYRVICECINNSLKHSNASKIEVDIQSINDTLYVQCIDNGKGFDSDKIMDGYKGIGLLNMQSRLKSVNGSFDLTSKIGEGTVVKFSVNAGAN